MNHKNFSLFLFASLSLAGSMILGYAFYSAYMVPAQAVTIYIDSHNEAIIEAIVFVPVILFSSVMCCIAAFKTFREGEMT